MKQKFLLPILMIVLLSGQVVSASANTDSVKIENSNTEIQLTITYANYLDADADGVEDDTTGHFNLEISSTRNQISFGLDILLTLPSGMQFLFSYFITTNYEYLEFIILMFNTALEPGWYDLEITITLYYGGYASGTALYIFDPPSASGNDPV